MKREPELFSINYPPPLSEKSRLLLAASALAQAKQAIRDHLHPTRTDVLSCLDAVESMAASFMEQGTRFGDIESGFERVRSALEVRKPLTMEQQAQEARDNWFNSDEPG